jgi:hypothetical protein
MVDVETEGMKRNIWIHCGEQANHRKGTGKGYQSQDGQVWSSFSDLPLK